MPVYITTSITNPKAKYYSLYDEQQLAKIKQEYGIANIDYIDIRCTIDKENHQYKNWNDLPPRKYDIIFLIHCPVYGIFVDDTEYKYINEYRKMYSDMRNHLKRNGYIYIEKNIRPAYVKVGNPDNGSIRRSKVEKGNTPEHIRKVYNDIFHDIKYSLDILDNADIDTLPFHITVESKHYKFRKGLQRVMILKFPRKPNMYSRKTKKNININ
jgi:hypothetical protein